MKTNKATKQIQNLFYYFHVICFIELSNEKKVSPQDNDQLAEETERAFSVLIY